MFAKGEYQQTRDGKTLVWNATPKAGDTASWSGRRDKDNYATGFGDLTWYNAGGKELGLFYGNMVRGKFEGAVNVHTNERTMHAYYVDGGRVTGWSRGRAPSKMPVPEEAIAERRKAEAQAKKEAKRAEPETTPVVKKAKPVTETVAKTEPTPQPQSSTERATQGPDTYHKETAEKSPGVAEKKSEPLAIEPPPTLHESATPEPSKSPSVGSQSPAAAARTFAEPTALPTSTKTETPSPENIERPTPNVEPAITEPSPLSFQETSPVLHEQKSEITQQRSPVSDQTPEASSTPPHAKETSADVSVNTLVGPPSALRGNAIPENAQEKTESASPPKPEGPLTESDVINLVDTEARSRGAPLNLYERPKVDHSVVKGKWTLFYARKSDAPADLFPFSATVEDATHKVELRK